MVKIKMESQQSTNTGDVKSEELTIQPAEIVNDQIVFTPKHLSLIKNQIAKDATPDEFNMFLMMAYRTRLDPLMNQLYFIKYSNSKPSYVTSIDGYRIVAHRTGLFAGVDEPKYEYQHEELSHCSITVYKLVDGKPYPFSAKVRLDEYDTGKNQWAQRKETMIAKVAEAHALRKAFPNDLSGIYTQDEMEQAEHGTAKSREPKVEVVEVNESGEPETPKKKLMNKDQLDEILFLLKKKGKNNEQLREFIEKRYQKTTMKDLTFDEAGEIINVLSTSFPDVVDQEIENAEIVDEPKDQLETAKEVFGDSNPKEIDSEGNEVNFDEADAAIEKMDKDKK